MARRTPSLFPSRSPTPPSGQRHDYCCATEGLRFHDLRHEYGSRLGDAHVNLKKIARLMDHSNTRQTERYAHPTDEGLLAATEIATRKTRGSAYQNRSREA